MAEFSFLTIAGPAQGLYKEKGSRFLSFAFPVASEDDVKRHLADLEKKHFDARHHCFAWVLGPDKALFRTHDAGEPNHSAGDPILGQIRSRNLTNVLVVVVRYFGGVKLGVGGLASAYKLAAADALDHAAIVEKDLEMTIRISYDYAGTADVMRLISDFDLAIEEQSFGADCVMTLRSKQRQSDALLKKVALLKTLGTIRDYQSPSTDFNLP